MNILDYVFQLDRVKSTTVNRNMLLCIHSTRETHAGTNQHIDIGHDCVTDANKLIYIRLMLTSCCRRGFWVCQCRPARAPTEQYVIYVGSYF